MLKLPRTFYDRDTVRAAREVLGTYLVRNLGGKLLVGQITESEAYVGRIDKACHAYQYRKTTRNAVMFGPPGHAYIYQIYGMHHCLNLVTEPEGEPSAVLIRGIQPVYGIDAMCRLRYGVPPDALTAYQKRNFSNGPGKLCRALDLNREQNGLDLTGDTLFLCSEIPELGLKVCRPSGIRTSARIGIDYAEEAKDFPWRFYL